MWSLAVLLGALSGASAVLSPTNAVVNLDDPPANRMVPAVEALLGRYRFAETFGPVFAHYNASLFSKVGHDKLDALLESVDKFFGDMGAEIRGTAAAISAHPNGSYVSPSYLAGWSWFHELAHTELAASADGRGAPYAPRACTAYLARDGSNRTVHGRNMDQEPVEVRYLAMDLDVRRGGATVVRAVDWYWFGGGWMTALRVGVAGMQENWRFPTVSSASVFAAAARGVIPQLFLFRTLLTAEPAPAWDALVRAVATTPLAAGMYVALSGPQGRGAVVVRNATGAEGVVSLGADGRFFLVVTNSDPWVPDPDGRRTAAEESAASLGQAVAASDLGAFAVISTEPTRNADTAYSAILRPDTGTLQAFVRSPLPKGA